MADLWTCPRCGRRFVTRNHAHSCGPWSLERHLADMTPAVRPLYEAFAALMLGLGDVTVTPARTRIGFQARTIFAAVTPRRRWLEAHVVLRRRVDNPRFRRIESHGPEEHVHRFRVTALTDLDDELRGMLAEAYTGYGQGRLTPSRQP